MSIAHRSRVNCHVYPLIIDQNEFWPLGGMHGRLNLTLFLQRLTWIFFQRLLHVFSASQTIDCTHLHGLQTFMFLGYLSMRPITNVCASYTSEVLIVHKCAVLRGTIRNVDRHP
jgi:hypothetical protein